MLLNETQTQVRDMARQFANDAIRPIAEELDREERFPHDLYLQMGELGLFGIGVPEDMGGPGFDTLTYALVMEELSRGYASVADQCGLIELISTLLVRHGNATFLMDLNSTNGTFVNSKRVSNQVLTHDDVITVGHHKIKFIDPYAQKRGNLDGPEFADTAIMKTLDDMRKLLAQENTALMPAASEDLPTLQT